MVTSLWVHFWNIKSLSESYSCVKYAYSKQKKSGGARTHLAVTSHSSSRFTSHLDFFHSRMDLSTTFNFFWPETSYINVVFLKKNSAQRCLILTCFSSTLVKEVSLHDKLRDIWSLDAGHKIEGSGKHALSSLTTCPGKYIWQRYVLQRGLSLKCLVFQLMSSVKSFSKLTSTIRNFSPETTLSARSLRQSATMGLCCLSSQTRQASMRVCYRELLTCIWR